MTARVIAALVLVCVLVCSTTVPASASVWTVDDTADTAGPPTCAADPAAGTCSLRQAVTGAVAAAGTDTVMVPPGAYNLIGAQGAIIVTPNSDLLTIDGAGPGVTNVSGQDQTRMLATQGGSTTVKDLTLTEGAATNGDGGAILNGSSTTLTLDNVAVTDSTTFGNAGAGFGGGISSQGTLNVINSTVSGNHAETSGTSSGTGGGVSASGTTTITNSTISGNTAHNGSNPAGSARGGGVLQGVGTLDIGNSTVSGNTAEGNTTAGATGGGIGVSSATAVSITGSTISGNIAGAPGTQAATGGGFNSVGGAVVTITDSTVMGNTAQGGSTAGGRGGGLFTNSGTLIATNVTISDNTSEQDGSTGGSGGGIDHNSTLSMTSSTLSGNHAPGPNGRGGNIFGGNSRFLKNTIVANGDAAIGSNCGLPGGGPVLTFAGRNLESANTCQLGAGDLIHTDPQLGALAANGGPTLTQAIAPGSPAQDAALDCPLPAADQRGIARPQFGACDIGAFEQTLPIPSPPPAGGGNAAGPDAAGPGVPANTFTIGKLKGKTLEVSVQAAGTVKVADAADKSAQSARKEKKKTSLGLKPSTATGGPGTIKVKLKLTSTASKTLKRSGKVKLKAKITFTTNGGTARSQATTTLKVKGKKAKRQRK